MVLHNPNNWHWVNKDTSGWARDYLSKELIGTSAEKDGVSAKIDKILSMDGDVDVSQRKGKVITLFDVKLQLEYSGKTKDDEDVSGTITVPEVAHDTEEDEYVFDIDIYSESLSKEPVKSLVRTQLTPLLRTKLITLGPALIAAHGAGLQHAKDTSGSSSTASATTSSSGVNSGSSKSSTSTSASSTSTSSSKKSNINTTTVSSTAEFRTTASQLYSTFTSAPLLAAFTRHPPLLSPSPTEATSGGHFTLFGGNVTGIFLSLEPPTRILQQWRLAQWPEGHHSELEIKFDQNDVDAVTVMRTEWRGVPVGQEEVTRRNWDGYYVQAIKRTFGFGTVL